MHIGYFLVGETRCSSLELTCAWPSTEAWFWRLTLHFQKAATHEAGGLSTIFPSYWSFIAISGFILWKLWSIRFGPTIACCRRRPARAAMQLSGWSCEARLQDEMMLLLYLFRVFRLGCHPWGAPAVSSMRNGSTVGRSCHTYTAEVI